MLCNVVPAWIYSEMYVKKGTLCASVGSPLQKILSTREKPRVRRVEGTYLAQATRNRALSRKGWLLFRPLSCVRYTFRSVATLQ